MKKTGKSKSSSKSKKNTQKKKQTKDSSQEKLFLSLGKHKWPVERDVLFRPDRYKYVRKLVPTRGCVFCAIEKEDPSLENLCCYKNEHVMVVLNKYPYNPGHLLVMPRLHCGKFEDLPSVVANDIARLQQKMMKALQRAYSPGGINLGLNQGAVAGAGIPEHLHFHLIPRWSGDLNFFPLIAETKVVVENLETTYQRIRAEIQSLD